MGSPNASPKTTKAAMAKMANAKASLVRALRSAAWACWCNVGMRDFVSLSGRESAFVGVWCGIGRAIG